MTYKNPEDAKAQDRKYYQEHKEQKREYDKEFHKKYYQAHKEQTKERIRKYRQEHKDLVREQSKKYHEAHKDQGRKYNKKYCQEHKKPIDVRKEKMLYLRFTQRKTLREIGEIFGVSGERVRQIIEKPGLPSRLPSKRIIINDEARNKIKSLKKELLFWSRVNIGSIDQCWEWTRFIGAGGYGRTSGSFLSKQYAHQAAYEYVFGKPKNQVLHECDNPACCNPAHLYDGTVADNMKDRDTRNSYTRGALFTQEEANEIRKIHASGISILKISKSYKISYMVMRNLIAGKTYQAL